MGKLSDDVTEEAIKEAYKELGDSCITNIRFLTNREDGSFKGCAFVGFASPELASMSVSPGSYLFHLNHWISQTAGLFQISLPKHKALVGCN